MPRPELSTASWPAHNGRTAQRGVVASCLAGTRAGRYWILTIRFKPSRWFCHPSYGSLSSCEAWGQDILRRKPTPRRVLPPRHIRKAAKMALRRVLGDP